MSGSRTCGCWEDAIEEKATSLARPEVWRAGEAREVRPKASALRHVSAAGRYMERRERRPAALSEMALAPGKAKGVWAQGSRPKAVSAHGVSMRSLQELLRQRDWEIQELREVIETKAWPWSQGVGCQDGGDPGSRRQVGGRGA